MKCTKGQMFFTQHKMAQSVRSPVVCAFTVLRIDFVSNFKLFFRLIINNNPPRGTTNHQTKPTLFFRGGRSTVGSIEFGSFQRKGRKHINLFRCETLFCWRKVKVVLSRGERRKVVYSQVLLHNVIDLIQDMYISYAQNDQGLLQYVLTVITPQHKERHCSLYSKQFATQKVVRYTLYSQQHINQYLLLAFFFIA